MSFTGDLEHLPIVDVIQLLHSTRKSGILRVKSRKGESQLVFKDGYIVSANHLNNRIRIGQILVDRRVITPEILEQTLLAQKDAGTARKPLIVTLLEKGLVKEEDAYKGLEQLIETTVVEILAWKKGTFTLDVLPETVTDEYRYYPERMKEEINFDTQGILMDALRIFDEKVRDGELVEEDFPDEEGGEPQEEGPLLSADDLGLADLDRLEKKEPEIFTVLTEYDPAKLHRQKLRELAPDLSGEELEELVAYLAGLSAAAHAGEKGVQPEPRTPAVVFFTPDELLGHCVTTACEASGMPVLVTRDEESFDPVIACSFARNSAPLLVCDAPDKADECFAAPRLASLRRQQREKHPQIRIVQLAAPGDAALALEAYGDGAGAVLPRPVRTDRREAYAADTIRFLQVFQTYLRGIADGEDSSRLGWLKTGIDRLHGRREAPEIALSLLQAVSGVFERSLTLVVRGSELIAEKGIGVRGEKGLGAIPAPGLRIPLAKPSLFRTVVDEGKLYYGPADDTVVTEHLFAAIGPPRHATVLLLPLQSRGKTVSLTYGDFGDRELPTVAIDLLAILASHAALVLENSLYRKKLEKSPAP